LHIFPLAFCLRLDQHSSGLPPCTFSIYIKIHKQENIKKIHEKTKHKFISTICLIFIQWWQNIFRSQPLTTKARRLVWCIQVGTRGHTTLVTKGSSQHSESVMSIIPSSTPMMQDIDHPC
jgi:hypothetical protein